MVLAVVLAVLMAASAYAQTTNFFELARTGTPQDVHAAIDKGANVNGMSSYGMAPLGLAASYNKNPEVITTLLKAGADLEARDKNGKTVLMYAATFNNPDMIAVLLKAGADVNARNTKRDGRTALMFAAEHDPNPEVISVLLKGGADAKAKDYTEKTAFDLAHTNYDLRGTDALKQLEEASK